MKKCLVMAVIMVMALSGCSKSGMENSTVNEDAKAESEINTSIDATEQGQGSETDALTASDELNEEYYEDNFSVSEKAVQEYAIRIQQAVEEKDMDKLSDLMGYPTYIGLGENGQIIESKEEFLKLESTEIFSEKLIKSVKQADKNEMVPCMAGFVLTSGEGAPSIIFGVQDGKLGITGINY